jgi:hypothetical protein
MSSLTVNTLQRSAQKDLSGTLEFSNKHILVTSASGTLNAAGNLVNYASITGGPVPSFFNQTTGVYTVPETGIYLISVAGASDSPGRSIFNLYVNDVNVQEIVDMSTQHGNLGNVQIRYQTAGDRIRLYLGMTSGNSYAMLSIMMVGR